MHVQENIGGGERVVRGVLGSVLLGIGAVLLDARAARRIGTAALAAGAYLTGTAAAGYCPVSEALGRDAAD